MTTTSTARKASDLITLDDARSAPRYDLGLKFYGGASVPEVVAQGNGRFVRHEDYLKALDLIELRECVIKILESEVEELLRNQEAL